MACPLTDATQTTQLNKHLSTYMQGLTAKVFRTYNASFTMAKLLRELVADDTAKSAAVAEKVKLYNQCNREVAILCNHKRTVGAGHEQQMGKLSDKIKAVQYKKWRVKQMILDLEPKQKKKKGADWFEIEDDITQEWITEHQAQLVEQEREKIRKKFEKENEKRAENKEKALPAKELKERLQAADEMMAKFKKENKSKKVEAEGRGATVEKLEAQIEKLDTQITNLKAQAEDREGNKEVALGTSKIVSCPRFGHLWRSIWLTNMGRTTSTPVLPSSSPRSLMCRLRSSFRRPCGRSSTGPSSRSAMKTGSFKGWSVYPELREGCIVLPLFLSTCFWRELSIFRFIGQRQ
jgi:hypothetical protein